MSRLLVFIYGVVSYFIGVIGLVSIITVLARLMPYGYLSNQPIESLPSVAWNVLLVAAWGFIHTAMARPSFKTVITKIIPEPAERATYVLVAGITSVILTGYWAEVPGTLWQIENTSIAYLLWGIFIAGWIFLFVATFAINHFDLFGLRQVYFYFKNQPRPPLNFVKNLMYRYVRHPIQTGVLIGIWFTPLMSATQLVLSIGFTVYIFVGLWFEERDLIREHGDEYRQYRSETGMVLPSFGNKQ